MSTTRIKTPCIGVCSTVFGDVVCRGCKRFSHEIINWNSYEDTQQQLVWDRIDLLTQKVVDQYFIIEAAEQLAGLLDQAGVRYPRHASAHWWLLVLLRMAGDSPVDYLQAGVRLRPQFSGRSTRGLYDDINEEIYLLAEANYDMYYRRAYRHLQALLDENDKD